MYLQIFLAFATTQLNIGTANFLHFFIDLQFSWSILTCSVRCNIASSNGWHYVQEIIVEKQELQHAATGITTLHHITVQHRIQYTDMSRWCKTILPTTAEHSFEACLPLTKTTPLPLSTWLIYGTWHFVSTSAALTVQQASYHYCTFKHCITFAISLSEIILQAILMVRTKKSEQLM